MDKSEFLNDLSLPPLVTLKRKLRANRTRHLVVALLLLLSTAFFAVHLNRVLAIKQWLFWSILATLGKLSLMGISSFVIGWQTLSTLLRTPPKLLERAALSFAVGVLVFFLSVYVGGLFRWYNEAFFYALPLSLFAIGAPRFITDLNRLRRHVKSRKLSLFSPKGPLETVAFAFLILALALVYVPILVPNNLSYDAIWYHLTIAEDYAAFGGIHPFREGWFLAAYPHLSSILYAWAFFGPGVLHEHVLLCAHIEFLLVLGTLLSVSALASKLVNRRIPYAAAAFFLFPGIYVYDSCLSSGADHILAFFTPVIALSLLRFAKNPTSVREAILSGALVAGSVSTKYQSCYLVVPSLLLIAFLSIRRRHWLAISAWFIAAGSVSATHWLKNLIYYHDPLYPLLHHWFKSRPYHTDVPIWLEQFYWPIPTKPVGVGWQKYLNTAFATLHFSFSPDGTFTWDNKALPLVGSLFTLLIPALFVMRKTSRLWWQVLSIQIGLAIWYLTTHQERFLQTLTPWMAAVVAAILFRLWRESLITRVALIPLVGLQVVWGADLFSLARHNMTGRAPLQYAIEHFASSYDAREKTRFHLGSTLEHLRPRLPRVARLLIHAQRLHLGLGVEVVTDETGWQGLINYLDHKTPIDTINQWNGLRLSHVMWPGVRAAEVPAEIGREVVFLRAIQQVAHPKNLIRDWFVEPLSKDLRSPELAHQPTRFLWLGCSFAPRPGIYSPRGWDLGHAEEVFTDDLSASELSTVNAVALERRCANAPPIISSLDKEFDRYSTIAGVEIWLRKIPAQ
jgi:hypothetical protein